MIELGVKPVGLKVILLCLTEGPLIELRSGQVVQTVSPSSAKAGTVGQIIWHFKDQEPKFFLVIDGRLEHRPYKHSELAPSPQSKG